MKRIFLTLFSIALIALLGLPAVAATQSQASLSLVSADELASVTGGRCGSRCDDDEEEEEEDDYVVGYEWLPTRQVDEPVQQLDHEIVDVISNVYGIDPKTFTVTYSDNCRYRWTSGGAGIAAGFNVSVGRTYSCQDNIKLNGIIRPGWRMRIYRADMRQVQRVTVGQFRVFSDGSSEPTGKSETGRRIKSFYTYSDVPSR